MEFTDHEKAIIENMSEANRPLMDEINEADRGSLEKNVTPESIKKIEGWMGSDQEIEDMLFWLKGGKYDDPAFKNLKPVDEVNKELMEKAEAHYVELRKKAVKKQKIADITLRSSFNDGLLFTGLAGSVRCSQEGSPDEGGEFFKGIEFRVIGSIDDLVSKLSIAPVDGGKFVVALGAIEDSKPTGMPVYTGDSHSALQLAQLIKRNFKKLEVQSEVKNEQGAAVEVDPKVIRKAAAAGQDIGLGKQVILHASKQTDSIDDALAAADAIIAAYYDRFGLEVDCWNIGNKFGNFYLLRDDNFEKYIGPQKLNDGRGFIMLTATLVCRRCRREIQGFYNMAKNFPNLNFALVQLNSPQFKFYERVFGDMGGGDPDEFRKNAAGVTPFIIVYKPNSEGVLEYAEYYGTEKDDFTPEYEDAERLFNKHFG
jgi:hypothetical protein